MAMRTSRKTVYTDTVGLHIPSDRITTKPHWSLACRAGGTVFTAGQPGVDRDGRIVGADTQTQTRQAFENLRLVLEEAGLRFSDIAKVRVFMREAEDYVRMNEVRIPYYEAHFPDGNFPASTAVVTGPLAVDGLAIEIEAFASPNKRCYDTEKVIKKIPLDLETQPHWRLGAIADDLLWTTGQPGLDIECKLVGRDAASQTHQCLVNTGYILEKGGFEWNDVVRLSTFLTDASDYSEMVDVRNRFLAERFPNGDFPASTTVQAAMPPPGMLVEIEAVARKGARQVVVSDRVSAAMPGSPMQPLYSPAVRAGNWVFLSGQVGTDAAGRIAPGDMRAQTSRTLHNVEALLEAAGARFEDIVHVTMYLRDPVRDYQVLNEVRNPFYEHRFADGEYPASTAIGGPSPAEDVLVEMEVIAWTE
jgi:enamine deaminase RidA (YjgF/YER057c/UK114 family)